MNRTLAVAAAALIIFGLAAAQKRTTVLGDAWTGRVVTADDSTREITIQFEEKGKAGTFTGVLIEGYAVKTEGGGSRELKVSEIPVGTRIRVFPKTGERIVGGRKAKVSIIRRIDFLGLDEFSRLRAALRLNPTAPVSLNEAGGLPESKPLRVYVASEDERIKARFINWAATWNREQAAKHGPLEIAPDFAAADVSLVMLEGAQDSVVSPSVIGPLVIGSDRTQYYAEPFTVFLVGRRGGGLEVLWKRFLLSIPEAEKGLIEKEVEQRMKARSKK